MIQRWRDDFMGRAGRCNITPDDARALLLIARRLQTWSEAECNGEIQRDETTNKPYRVYGQDVAGSRIRRFSIRDMETPAMKRAEAIAAKYNLKAYFQGDPRGAMIQLYRPGKDNPETGSYLLAVPS